MPYDLIMHVGFLLFALVWATPREERSSAVGMGRALLDLVWWLLATALFSTFVMAGLFELLCAHYPSAQWVGLWRHWGAMADLRAVWAPTEPAPAVALWDWTAGEVVAVAAAEYADFAPSRGG